MFVAMTKYMVNNYVMYLAWQNPVHYNDRFKGYYWTYKKGFLEMIDSPYISYHNTPKHPFLFDTEEECRECISKLNLPQKWEVVEFKRYMPEDLSDLYDEYKTLFLDNNFEVDVTSNGFAASYNDVSFFISKPKDCLGTVYCTIFTNSSDRDLMKRKHHYAEMMLCKKLDIGEFVYRGIMEFRSISSNPYFIEESLNMDEVKVQIEKAKEM